MSIVEMPLSILRNPRLAKSTLAVSAVILNDPPEAIVNVPAPAKVTVPVGSNSVLADEMVYALAKLTVWLPRKSMVPPPVRFELEPMVVVVESRYSVLPEATSISPSLVSNVVAVMVAVASILIKPSLVMSALIEWVATPPPVWAVLIVPALVSVPLLTVSD